MENSAKALLIAGGVLIGIMILSLAVSLYSSLSGYIETTQEEIRQKETQQFNEQFTKYINCNNIADDTTDFTLTIQDIVTAANAAYQNNLEYQLTSGTGENYYVTINMPGKENLERSVNTDLVGILTQYFDQEYIYKCSIEDVKISPTTGRVYEVTFH